MFITSPIDSVSHPGYTHPPGTEATLSIEQGAQGGFRLLTLTVYKEDGEVDWTEQFRLPQGMKVDPHKPAIIVPEEKKP